MNETGDVNIEYLVNKIEELESKVEEKNNKITELQDQVDELTEESKILQSRVDHISEYTQDLGDDLEYVEDIIVSEDRLYLTPAEKLLSGQEWDDIHISKSKNKRRAIDILEKWNKYASYVNNDGTQRLFVKDIAKQNEYDHQTAERIAKYIEQLTNTKIELHKQDSNLDTRLILNGDEYLITSKDDIKQIKENNTQK